MWHAVGPGLPAVNRGIHFSLTIPTQWPAAIKTKVLVVFALSSYCRKARWPKSWGLGLPKVKGLLA